MRKFPYLCGVIRRVKSTTRNGLRNQKEVAHDTDEVQKRMRYRIETYRGYEYEEDYEKAIETAVSRLKEVAHDNPSHREIWWVKISDKVGLYNKLMYFTDEGQMASTPWLT